MNRQHQIDQMVKSAAAAISMEIDRMLDALPADVDQDEIAENLIDRLLAMSQHQDFVEIFNEGILARRALIKLGVKF